MLVTLFKKSIFFREMFQMVLKGSQVDLDKAQLYSLFGIQYLEFF